MDYVGWVFRLTIYETKQKKFHKFDSTVRENVDGFVMEISEALDAACRRRERSVTIVNVRVKFQVWRNLQESEAQVIIFV